jgi:hypothetical protein
MQRLFGVIVLVLVAHATSAASEANPRASSGIDAATAKQWIEQMKRSERGPFERIRWFCKDGTVLPPEPYACKEHGGGRQHGEWNDRTVALRQAGYLIANVLAGIEPERVLDEAFYDEYRQILLEQFLIQIDNGWILRKARFYRGAFQAEGESRNARRIFLRLVSDNRWVEQRYAALRAGLRLIPHGNESRSVVQVRQQSADLARRSAEFVTLRNKIHARPELGDAADVRAVAEKVSDPGLRREFLALADLIEAVYGPRDLREETRALAAKLDYLPDFGQTLIDTGAHLALDSTPAERFAASAVLMAGIREGISDVKELNNRLALIDLSLELEDAHFAAASELRPQLATASRRTLIDWLAIGMQAVYGSGFISDRQRDAWTETARVFDTSPLSVGDYKRTLEYLSLLPSWSAQRLRMYFFDAMQAWQVLEPSSMLFVQDQLRGSPLFFYSDIIDNLSRDANRLAGVEHSLFGERVGTGLRGLNPGLARGVLRLSPEKSGVDAFESDGIYLLPETIAELPPVAGILTAGEGNPLSHVQLLARNLGIPNVGIDEGLISRLAEYEGRRVQLAVSPGGVVELNEETDVSEQSAEQSAEVMIHPDLAKLDLSVVRLIPLNELRADDSGRTVGPKAAKLGELKHHYPEAVAEGLAIPFGVFRRMLDRPMPGTNGSLFDWMAGRYDTLALMREGSPERAKATEAFRARLEDIIATTDPGDAFKQELRSALERKFGPDGSYGVFVRSDTNVEDLPGFTGAGLNLTVPNVVGYENILTAISRVWASPFSARAFAWRQSRMDTPEHVYPAVLLLRSVDSDKSGVLVTQDIDSGSRDWISVAVNEGVGGAVDGQAAESLRININSGEVRLLAQATAPWRRQVSLRGGVDKIPVSKSDYVLKPAEISQLMKLARELPHRFPAIVDAQGQPAPADIEFGFQNGELRLFQIRPFLESKSARASGYLAELDNASRGRLDIPVDLQEVPR